MSRRSTGEIYRTPSWEFLLRVQLSQQFYFGPKKEGITFLWKDAVDMVVESLKDLESRGEPIGPGTPLLQVYEAVLRVPGKGKVNTWLGEWHTAGSRRASGTVQGGLRGP